MRHLNKTFLLSKGVFLGEKSYTFKTKSLIFKKFYSNFIFDFNQSSFYLKKALNLVSDSIRNYSTILIYSRDLGFNKFKIINLSKINSRIIYISDKWTPGTINNYLTRKQFNIKKIPELVIILNRSTSENNIVLKEASCLSIPCVLLFSSNFNFDLIPYPLWGDNFNPSVIKLFLSFFYNSVLHGLLKIKYLKIKNKIFKNKKNKKIKKNKLYKNNVKKYKTKI